MDKDKEELKNDKNINSEKLEKLPVLSDTTPDKSTKQTTFEQKPQQPAQEPSWFSRYSLQLFVFNFSLLQLFQMTAVVYWIGVVRTIEKRFGLSSTQTNFVMSVNDIVHISIVIFVGYFGRKGHKPKIIAGTAQFLVIGSLLMATPYFLYGDETSIGLLSNESSYHASISYCDPSRNTTERCEEETTITQYIKKNVWIIFICAAICNGLGGVAMQVLGMAYVDENADKTKSSLYLGIISSTFALGPIVGFFLAALATKYPENLQSDTDASPSDPTWIGAWWVGYVVCAILIFVTSIPVFCYPKQIRTTSGTNNSTEKQGTEESLWEQAKDFPVAFLKLLSNKAFMSLLFTSICNMYLLIGVYMNIPRYLEIHFLQPAFIANLGAAIPGMTGVVGGFMGGAMMTKLRFGPVASAKMYVFASVATCVGLFFLMFISCPQVNLAGEWDAEHESISIETSCNSNCSCSTSKQTYHPICGTDGATYFSPCHAGCSVGQIHNDTMLFTDCKCADVHTATDGLCEEPCTSGFYLFATGMLIMSLVGSLGRVPSTVIQFRIVGDEEGSFALGVTSFAINLLAFIPGPILFGVIIDSTCILWQEVCGESGACLFYNTRDFRLLTYGVSIAFQFVACLFSILVVVFVSRMDFSDPEQEQEQKIKSKCDIRDSKQQLLMMEKLSGYQ